MTFTDDSSLIGAGDDVLAQYVAVCRDAIDESELDSAATPLLRRLLDHATGGMPEALDALLQSARARIRSNTALSDLQARSDYAQQLANMGDYDWHIATDTNQWSDQLYRIYGYEPQSFNASYEKFMSLIHPADRDRVGKVHQAAYANGGDYEMIERVVRPDGELRYLKSNGQVVTDEWGTPVRMRGTCVDITDRIKADEAREQAVSRLKRLVESSPEAIVVFDQSGQIVQSNRKAHELLCGDPVGRAIDEILPEYRSAGQAVEASGLDGRMLTLDVDIAVLAEAGDTEGPVMAAFIRDAKARLASESLAANLREAQVRRRHALDLNDNVVQGLTAAALALTADDLVAAESYLSRTLVSARSMMNNFLIGVDDQELVPGDLVRGEPSTIEPAPAEPPKVEQAPVATTARILVVDDNVDVRRLLAAQLERDGYTVVGEASDGLEAVDRAQELNPDVVVMDLAMPRMDGLQALPLILAKVPSAKVVIVSGFDQGTMREKVMAAGATRYVEKGIRMNLTDIVQEVLVAP
ncbi:MAG TPA: response regulator [Nocardioidaceae bacterium]|nr:response regulator [Nocardioidaceae bacterium]